MLPVDRWQKVHLTFSFRCLVSVIVSDASCISACNVRLAVRSTFPKSRPKHHFGHDNFCVERFAKFKYPSQSVSQA